MARWHLLPRGRAIEWVCGGADAQAAHSDDIEMAGRGVSYIVRYGMDENGGAVLSRHVVFPALRTRPNNTHASFQFTVPEGKAPHLLLDGEAAAERAERVVIDGTLRFYTTAGVATVERIFYPANTKKIAIELVRVTNNSGSSIRVSVDKAGVSRITDARGPMGVCIAEAVCLFDGAVAAPGETVSFAVTYTGRLASEETPVCDAAAELSARRAEIERLRAPASLETGNGVIDALYAFSKVRAGESIFDTKAGLLHSPGGKSYYAAVWCNDQVEYAGPWFAFTGDDILKDASYNAYKLYLPFMDDAKNPIPSSIIAEGVDYWDGAGDRGDAAMYLYGCSRFLLACGDLEMAKKLWGGVKWSAEYCLEKKTDDGVIASDSDELEGRFPSGDANLSTSCLCYAGLRSASKVAAAFGEDDTARRYTAEADALAAAIEKHFGAVVEGYETYAYYKGCEVLRSWLCLPLCVGLKERVDGTTDALLSDHLLTPDGLLTAEDDTTVWDRSTLYGLRGLFAAGKTEEAMHELLRYSENRLLGERVPYPVEAYPEGGRRHLSAESALYCRIFTEGLLGIEPEGFDAFSLAPRLPACLDHITMSDIRAFGQTFSIEVDKNGWRVINSNGTTVAFGKNDERSTVSFANA